jgi:AcrR family transcriptional regulator
LRRERRKEARPGELLEAALALFVEKGFAATRVEDVAQRAGVSKGTLFLYFPSKLDLFKAVVRENIVGRFAEWNEEFHSFTGNTADMVRYCMHQWWERIGNTPASGITKLVMSEGSQFPELAEFYRQEVIVPGNTLIRRILQRGMERGEFRPLDLNCAIYSIIAPMIFIIMWKHSMAPCCALGADGVIPIEPHAFITSQAEVLLHGLQHCPAQGRASPSASPDSTPLPAQDFFA